MGNESDKITIINAAAVADNHPEKTMTFNVDPSSIFNSSGFWKNDNWEEFKINTISLKEIFERFHIEKIDILKIDIEGAEWAMLEEFDDAYYNRIDQITVEFHDFVKPEMQKRTKNVVKKLKTLGYRHKFKGIEYMHNSVYYDSLFYKSDEKVPLLDKVKNFFTPNEKYKIN